MGVWVVILAFAVGVPGTVAFCVLGLRAVRSAKARLDGDQVDAEEMLAAFGATGEWV